jgi:hypothetical protein
MTVTLSGLNTGTSTIDTAAQTHAAASKTTPVDADEIPLADSAAIFGLKKLTWANLKATAKTYFDTLYAGKGANTDITSLSGVTSINAGPLGGFRNRIINGNFSVNQRSVTGTVVLTAGVYGHDRFKAGASGCTYTFSTTANVTTLTISAGSLVQVVEGLNVQSGNHVLSWVGTATGKIDAGSFSASGVTGTLTGGTNCTVEFSTGTLSKVQLEPGSTATTFEQRPYGVELAQSQRYYELIYSLSGVAFSTTTISVGGAFKVTKRATPTMALVGSTPYIGQPNIGNFTGSGSVLTATNPNLDGCEAMSVSGFTGLTPLGAAYFAGALAGLTASAEL